MNILVTGASGITGSCILDHLAGDDSVSTFAISRRPVTLNTKKTFEANLSSQEMVMSLVPELKELGPIDGIIHLAADPNPNQSSTELFLENNIISTKNIISLAKDIGAKKILFSSSLSVFGEIRESVADENTDIINPNPYGTSKLVCESLLKESGIDTLALRLPGILAPRAHGPWLAKVAAKIKNNEDIQIFNPDNPFNNLVHAEDIAKLALTYFSSDLKDFHMATMSCSGSLTTMELVTYLKKCFESTSDIAVKESSGSGFQISNQKLETLLNFKPGQIKDLLDLYCKSEKENE